jgi:hypothetical protein
MRGPDGELPGRGILTPESIDMMFTKVMDLDEQDMDIPTAIGLGYFLNFPKDLPGITAIQHSGGNTGWRTFMISIPEAQVGLVILTNSHTGMKIIDALIFKWKEHLMKLFGGT